MKPGFTPVHTTTHILGFFGPYRFLSNFEMAPVDYNGLVYPSNENAYQAAKVLDRKEQLAFLSLTPNEAKKAGQKVLLRLDWEDIKLGIMEQINTDKFTRNQEIRQRLLDTGTAYLEETNWWNDTFWGVCSGRGTNHLGQILMHIRATLKTT